MKRTRFLFYLLIGILVSTVDFMSDFGEDPIEEVLFFAILTLPSVLGLTYLVYYLRKWILSLDVVKLSFKGKLHQKLLQGVLILIKSLGTALFARYLSIMILPELAKGQFFDQLFWGLFIGIFCVILFVYALEAFIEVERQKQEFKFRLKDQENQKLVAKYLNLKNQLNPHFLFNSFNSLSGLISMDPKKAEYFLSELSNIYRYNLEQSDELVVTLEKELELIRSYIALQQIRFGESLVIDYNVDAIDLEKMLPPMTLQLLIENAIKHNSVEKEHPLKISIRTLGGFVIVSNNYQPRKNSNKHGDSTGKGLNNLINQYSMIHSETPKFDVKNGNYVAIIPLIEPT